MESDITQSALFYRLWEWAETNRKQLLWGTTVVAVIAFAIGFYYWHGAQNESNASDALSRITAPAVFRTTGADAYLKVATEYSGTDAAARALLLAGARLFSDGKFAEAQAQFDRYLRDYRNGPFAAQASLGRAGCLEAQGKSTEAITAYKDIADHHPSDNVARDARLALGRLYESTGSYDLARAAYEQLAGPGSMDLVGAEAAIRLAELTSKHPAAPEAPVTPNPTPMLAPLSTNSPAFNLQKR